METHPPTTPIRHGQRVEVQLNRGWADEWVRGTVLDPLDTKVELDASPRGTDVPKIVTERDIYVWRPSGSSWEPEFVMCDARLAE